MSFQHSQMIAGEILHRRVLPEVREIGNQSQSEVHGITR